ncbi:MAG: PTS sugar transporter subunit IIA [Eubacteriales bacterium]|nr:PTS sugar transporter subunit IIA [Eubacteriales bacterium]
MVGVLLISHGGMAEGVLSSASMLVPQLGQVDFLALWPEDNPDEFQAKLGKKIDELDTGDGVFLLADMLGGTPSNRAMYFVGDRVRVLTGLSLPMLYSLISMREEFSDREALADEVMAETQNGTVDVNKLLRGKG